MMDHLPDCLPPTQTSITCVETHTTGEPTRIVISGYPALTPNTTLLAQRAEAQARHDHIRRRLLLEPRGHADMYGALLRPDTELVRDNGQPGQGPGPAHMGVLFMHNEGYSTMCGHATLALGRVLIDTHDRTIFPRRADVPWDRARAEATLVLHAPCGLVRVTVPVSADGRRSDPTRPVSFLSVPSFATGRDVVVAVPPALRWPELEERTEVRVAFAYGGAFTCLVSAEELGFGGSGTGGSAVGGGLRRPGRDLLEAYDRASRALKAVIHAGEKDVYRRYFRHPEKPAERGSLYTVMVVDKAVGVPEGGLTSSSSSSSSPSSSPSRDAETGLCFFADQQIDRSPTGSVVAARAAYAYAIGELAMGQARTYHSLVSNSTEGGRGGFVGTVVDEVSPAVRPQHNHEREEEEGEQEEQQLLGPVVRVKVEGYAYYTGYHVFVVEKEDPLGEGGFLFARLGG